MLGYHCWANIHSHGLFTVMKFPHSIKLTLQLNNTPNGIELSTIIISIFLLFSNPGLKHLKGEKHHKVIEIIWSLKHHGQFHVLLIILSKK